MRIAYDPPKRDGTLANRGLDFQDAASVFDGLTAEIEDKRKDYGEARIICFGLLPAQTGSHRVHATWRSAPCFQHEKGQ